MILSATHSHIIRVPRWSPLSCGGGLVTQSRLTLATPWPARPLSMGFSRQNYWSGLPFPSPGDLPYPKTEPVSLASPALPGGFFTMSTSWEALRNVQFSSVAQSCLILCDPMDCSNLASLSITNSQSLLKLMSIESMMPSNPLILCRPLLLLSSVIPSIRVFSNESTL